jgi:phosphatidylglycerol:prolipoprotein diacylglycerol transferase
MINFLHTFRPEAIWLSFEPINIYWYGLFIVLGMLAALLISLKLAKYYELSAENIFDLSFWLIIAGLAGARLYDVGLNLRYYLIFPEKILAVWEGGLAIHGGIIAGLIVIWLYGRRKKINFWKLGALIVPGLALAQTIGRWGNYFNQEIFGQPTTLAWGIPIDPSNRPIVYQADQYFHPVFLYESLGCLLIAAMLLIINWRAAKRKTITTAFQVWSVNLYMILYSILRFFLEFIRLDETPHFLGWRWPQIVSLIMIILGAAVLTGHRYLKKQTA